MTQVMTMSSGAIDPIAVAKRVFWRPVTTGTPLKVGDPVCYKLDAVDHKKRTVDPTHLGLTIDTYAEGEQEMTGRLFSVEEPLIDNIDAFAGIVKSLGQHAGADGDMIEIWIPNGAVVPANVVLAATVTGRTILSVMVGTRTLGSPTSDLPNYGLTAGTIDSKVVGIAMETIAAAGLCWVKLDDKLFAHLGGNIGNELQVAAGTVNVTVAQMNINFLNTAGNCQALHYRATLSSTGECGRGVYRLETFLKGTHTNQPNYALDNIVDLSTLYVNVGGRVVGMRNTIRSRSVNPNLTGSYISVYNSEIILTKTTTGALDAGDAAHITHFYLNGDANGTSPDCLFLADNKKFICMEASAVAADDAAANSIKIFVQGAYYYIPAYTAAEIA